jgi:uncharacterized membrane protein YccC
MGRSDEVRISLYVCREISGEVRVVNRSRRLWTRLAVFLRRHKAQLALSVRMTIATAAALVLAQVFGLRLPLWSVLTAVIVTQMSVGRSLIATIDYLAGTLGGAVYGGAIGILIPHTSEVALLGVLALAVAPLALIASINPRLSAAPVTAIIVLLVPTMTAVSPLTSAFDRVIEVAIGGVTGLVVSLLLLPSPAHPQLVAAAAQTLFQMAQALSELLTGLTRGLDVQALHRIQDGIGHALVHMNAVGDEAERERSTRLLRTAPDTGPLLRTLLRLRHDLVIIGRTATMPLPETLASRLAAPLTQVSTAFVDYLRGSGAALLSGRTAPAREAVEAALDAYSNEVAALRNEGLTRGLPGDRAEHFFALGFALEGMRGNFRDLERCVAERARVPKT